MGSDIGIQRRRSERRGNADRRAANARRSGMDRRHFWANPVGEPEQWVGDRRTNDRRVGFGRRVMGDRRSGMDRRLAA